MNKTMMTAGALALIIAAVPCAVSAQTKSTKVAYDICFGDEVYTNEFVVSWSEAENDDEPDSNDETYRNGSTGAGVREIQSMLSHLGYYDGKISGNFGDLTEGAVRRFQRDHGFEPNGVADPKTIAAIRKAFSASSGSGDASTVYYKIIYNLSWTDSTYRGYLKNWGLNVGKTVKLTDIATGLSFYARSQNGVSGNHADLEPLTASDTATMLRIYGVDSVNNISWRRRGMVMTLGEVQVVCSMYGQAHGQQVITDNNFNGQFCIHFLNSTIHTGDGGSVPESENHQAIIREAVETLQKKVVDGVKITVKTTYP